jgi:competence protein ComEC
LVGAGASVVRSVIMTIISLYGKIVDRSYDPMRGLFVAGLFMLVFNPMLLFFDASFQMSFMATFGLIYLSDKISRRLTWLTKKFGVREIISSTLATQITVTPLIMHFSGMISIISPITNILILPFIPYTMFVVTLTALASFISSVIAWPFGFVSYLLLSYELKTVHYFSMLNFSAVQFEKWTWSATLICYAVLVFAYIILYFGRKTFKKYFIRKSATAKQIDQFFERHKGAIPDG